MPDTELESKLRATIRNVPDFPKQGIMFKDITPMLGDPALFARVIAAMAEPFRDQRISHVAAIESRGFIFGAPIALALGVSFVPMRKPGKLPHVVEREEYELEYGKDAIEMHRDAMGKTARVLIVDDLLATGGTAGAACRLAERLGASVVACSFVIELGFLSGRAKLGKRDVRALISY